MTGELRGARGVALVVRFLLELALLAGAAAWMLRALPDPWGWIATVVLLVGIGVIWGLLLAPRRPFEVGGAARLLVEAALFVGVGVGLATTGAWLVAALGVALWALDRLALALLPEPAAL